MSKTVAYLRVSTDKQDVENQKLEILTLVNEKGLGKVEFVEDVVTGRKTWRDRKIAQILENLKEGDALVISELSRLGRSMLEIMEILSISTQKKIKVFASKGKWSLDGSMQSKIIAMCFSMAAEIENDLRSQRIKSMIATRKDLIKKSGQPYTWGRKPGPGKSKLEEHHDKIVEFLKLGVMKKNIAEMFHTTPANLRHYLKKRNL